MKKRNEGIYQLIRNEDVLLWAGAGFSLYAGFPSGYGLSQKIYEGLAKTEIKQIGKNLDLDLLSEEFVRLKGGSRNQLNRILMEVFKKEPDSLEQHKAVVHIPHFKTIVTTNYDTLFEKAYTSDKINSCWKDEHIPYIDNKKSTLFKVHGCISDLDSIILSKSDYSTFYGKDFNTPFWSTLISLLSTKTVLFIGYGYEDSNIWHLFDKLSSIIGMHKKQAFLVVPKMQAHKVAYLSKKGITVIQQSAEDFLQGLIKDIQDNIITDFNKQKVSVPTFNSVLAKHNLSAEVKTTNDNLILKSLTGLTDKVRGQVQFTIAKNLNGDLINDILGNDDLDEIVIPASELKQFAIRLEGLKLPLEKQNIVSITFQNQSIKNVVFDIRFLDTDFELQGLSARLYPKKDKIKIVVNHHETIFELFISTDKIPIADISLSIIPLEIITNVGYTLKSLRLYYNLVTAQKFELFIPETNFSTNHTFPTKADEPAITWVQSRINYLTLLKRIESHFCKRFSKIEKISSKDQTVAETIERSFTHEKKKKVIDGEITISVDFSHITKESLISMNREQHKIVVLNKERTIVKLHNLEFDLGHERMDFQIEEITNLEDVLSEKTNSANIKVVESIIEMSFSETYQLNNDTTQTQSH